MGKKALLVIDVQRDFCVGGSLQVSENADKIVPVINDLIDRNDFFDLVVASKDWHPADHGSFASNNEGKNPGDMGELDGQPQVMWPDHCIQGNDGSRFHVDLNSQFDYIIHKGTDKTVDSYSAFEDNNGKNETMLEEILKDEGITDLYVVGLATDYCVKFTVLSALKRGFNVTVITDAIDGVNINKTDVVNALGEMLAGGAILADSDRI